MTSSLILLADGSTFRGEGFGASGTSVGEFVFHTGMTGYQEILTDPSYCGQVVTMTYPEIGNTGINDDDMESDRAWLTGFVVRNLAPVVSNWRSKMTLADFLKAQGVTGIANVNTRALTLRLRERGAMMGIVSDQLTAAEMKRELKKAKPIESLDLIDVVTTKQPYFWREGSWQIGEGFRKIAKPKYRVVAYDFGVKRNILRLLADQGCEIEVVPAGMTAVEVLEKRPDGVFLSNGPGDPRRRADLSEKLKSIVGKVPVFGICFGFQLLGPALGGSIVKLPFGHHGANHPVKHADANIWITSQNHNYVVETKSLPKGCEITDINLNDQTLEGFIDRKRGVLAIQYHPEASPGPHDAIGLFRNFAEMMDQWKN